MGHEPGRRMWRDSQQPSRGEACQHARGDCTHTQTRCSRSLMPRVRRLSKEIEETDRQIEAINRARSLSQTGISQQLSSLHSDWTDQASHTSPFHACVALFGSLPLEGHVHRSQRTGPLRLHAMSWKPKLRLWRSLQQQQLGQQRLRSLQLALQCMRHSLPVLQQNQQHRLPCCTRSLLQRHKNNHNSHFCVCVCVCGPCVWLSFCVCIQQLMLAAVELACINAGDPGVPKRLSPTRL